MRIFTLCLVRLVSQFGTHQEYVFQNMYYDDAQANFYILITKLNIVFVVLSVCDAVNLMCVIPYY